MIQLVIYGMIYLGSALMVYNIIGFFRYARYVRGLKIGKSSDVLLHFSIILLAAFLLGYLAVGFFGKPDLIISAILFGGSIFVFVMYRTLNHITRMVVKSEHLGAELRAVEESNRAKANFLSNISHEMRTPMNIILGLDAVALKDPDLNPGTRDHLEKIGQSGRYLLGLINNILDINRVEAGKLQLKQEDFSLPEAFNQVNAIIQTLCADKGLEYRFVSESLTGIHCKSDEVRLKQVLLSILDNAVKYTEAPGSVTFEASMPEKSEDNGVLRFVISDTGVGIDGDDLPMLFEAFSEMDTGTTNRYGGNGLGLALTKQLVELFGGTIEVDSEKNKGSVFTVTIPVKYEEKQDLAEEELSLEGRRILIVEDVPENAEIVADLLELQDAESEHAENGKLALEMFTKNEPWYYDAILMDLRMPVMDGLEATRRIRALPRSDAKFIPIIALSANSSESDRQQTKEAGMDAHLAKPSDAETLYGTLGRMIRDSYQTGRRSII